MGTKKGLIKKKQKDVKEFEECNFSDKTIREVSRYSRLGIKTCEIARLLQISESAVSTIKGYLKRCDFLSKDVMLAAKVKVKSNIEKNDISTVNKVMEHAIKHVLYPQEELVAPVTAPVLVNVDLTGLFNDAYTADIDKVKQSIKPETVTISVTKTTKYD